MLEPERRQLLLDALHPPPGFAFDAAVGTTFTLDLVALLVTPVAFALFDVEADDGRALANPIAVLEAVRRHADRITVFAQAGEIKVPGTYRGAYAYLERSVVPVKAPRGGIFHPKVWCIRYVAPDGEIAYRFLCLSRNLTFDRSWDTVLRLDGRTTTASRPQNEPIREFLGALPGLAVGPVSDERRAGVRQIADEIATVEWEGLPDGLHLEGFIPMGHDGRDSWPFPPDSWRRLIVAPFVGPDFVARYTKKGRQDYLVSREETIDSIGKGPLAHLGRVFVLKPETTDSEGVEEEPPGSPELRGLHAKLFVMNNPYRARMWTGSANATMQAFTQNVEFLVELSGTNRLHSPEALTATTSGPAVGFGRLLMDYEPAEEATEPGPSDEAARALDLIARTLGAMRFAAEAEARDGDRFLLQLHGTGDEVGRFDGVRVRVRPMSLGLGAAVEPITHDGGFDAQWTVSFGALTEFFAIDLETGEGAAAASTSFLVVAILTGAPPDRLERILASEIRNRSALLRLLLLLLGNLDAAFGDLMDIVSGEPTAGASDAFNILGSDALLEPLMRTLARDPGRLDEIERLVAELSKTEEGRGLFPEGWMTLWESVSAARPLKEPAA